MYQREGKNSATMKTTIVFLSMMVAIMAVDLPNGFKICKLSDPDIIKCLSEAITIALSVLINGDSALKILPIEPLTIDYMRINSSGPVSLIQEYRNMKIHGMAKNVQVFAKNFDVNTFALFLEAFNPQLNITCDYEFNGRILLLPLQGKGKGKMTLYNTTMTIDVEYERYERHGESYLKLKKLNFYIKDTDIKVYFENLFGKDSNLGEEMNRLLNENAKIIFKEIKPAYEELIKQVIVELADKIYSNFPIKKLLPPV
ncbi:PREDICTED: protein takeout-like [Dinoponera quadriceps]|uniref:Protein takeout-like n=1 Tax=Dinoponera quadriceps TaxID=609295 RepID=A0A6P3Y9U5_DINQU|nr:PREDICTED: protein takeout-like [Dinoponera quadriceps]